MTSRLPIMSAAVVAAALFAVSAVAVSAVAVSAVAASGAAAQAPAAAPTSAAAPGASGHWAGTLDVPSQPIDVEIDLKPDTPPAWVGTITIAAQNLRALPLGAIQVQGKSVSFEIPKVPGAPSFKGTLSDDGTTMNGEFSQGGGSLPFKLTRKGDAVFTPPAKSSSITKEFEGDWSGTLQVPDRTLRLNLKLASGPDGATGSIISVDQGGAEIPIATITQVGMHLELELPAIAGKYSGDLKDGKLVGTWMQGPGSLPLEFSRSAP